MISMDTIAVILFVFIIINIITEIRKGQYDTV